MEQVVLPPVAKSIYLECKKCGAEKYHRVLAHTSATSAKVECEICGSKKTYKLPRAAKKVSRTGKPRVSKVNGAKAHDEEYGKLIEAAVAQAAAPYSMATRFSINQKLQHPKFGVGVIRMSFEDKIEVIFPDQVRLLVHNRI
jgi:hypothetical protein